MIVYKIKMTKDILYVNKTYRLTIQFPKHKNFNKFLRELKIKKIKFKEIIKFLNQKFMTFKIL
jgi:hypothetical protein